MDDKETVVMIQRCIEEITLLRQQIDRLAPKAAAYDSISKILDLIPGRPMGAAPDIVWELRRKLEELQPRPDRAAAEGTA